MTQPEDEMLAAMAQEMLEKRRQRDSGMAKMAFPPELENIREIAQRVILPIRPADSETKADKNFLFKAIRTEAGRELPPYYLVYFLLVDLLGFKDLGRFEKIAFSVPIDFNGTAYLIEHRKFGLGVFAPGLEDDEQNAQSIVKLIKKAVSVAQPFFRWVADYAVQKSKLNVKNNGADLFERYEYFRNSYQEKWSEAEEKKDEVKVTRHKFEGGSGTSYRYAHFQIRRDARWLATAAIEAFFSWTEHIFIHLAILQGGLTTGKEVAEAAGAEWNVKFKKCLDVADHETKGHFDQLITIRRQLRNFIAHGAFGKEGEAFHFHSSAGAVPLAFDRRNGKNKFTMSPELAFEDAGAIKIIEDFIAFLWSGSRAPAKIYIQEGCQPLILTMAQNGTYARAMSSVQEMREFVDYLVGQSNNAANMDW